jgi:hypothetical protein
LTDAHLLIECVASRLALAPPRPQLLPAVDVWIEVMRDEEAPASARPQAVDRIVERLLGRVGEKLLVQRHERQVTVHCDVEWLAEIVSELKRMGAIE